MESSVLHSLPAPGLWADVILVLHVGIVLFVVLGQGLIMTGAFLGWAWIRNPWFRLAHLATIVFVVLQAWFERLCPLTLWEQELRRAAGQAAHDQGFIEHWLSRFLYYDLPAWVFVLAYTVFGLLVLASWWWLPPRAFRARPSR